MSKPNLNSMPGYQADMPKKPHDVSQSTAFTSSTGMILPVYYDMLHLGDTLHFDAKMFTRLNPLNTGALAEIDLHLDYYFVPLSMLYTPTLSIFYQTDDMLSSNFKTSSFDGTKFPVFDLDGTIRWIKSNYQGGVNGSQRFNVDEPTNVFPNSMFDCVGKSIYRLLDFFDYSYYALFADNTNQYNPNHTPWFLSAYQCIYQKAFRNTDREASNYAYQLDNKYQNTSSPFQNPDLLRLNYASQYKDYFNSVKVSPIGSTVSLLSGVDSLSLLSQVNSYLYDNTFYVTSNSSGINTPDSSLSTTVKSSLQSQTTYPGGGLSSANIRQLFMVDKLLRVLGRAEKDYESQFLAHFGVKIPHDNLHNITHIGHDMVTLSPSPIISSADTWNGESGSALGEVGGQGVASLSGKRRKFTAPFHGVFMCVYHAVPRMRYYAGISKLHDLSDPMKFWQPEYDRRGMQPIFGYEAYRDRPLTDLQNRLGWQYGYEQFKRKYDRVTDVFRNPQKGYNVVNSYSTWVLSREPYRFIAGDGANGVSAIYLLTSPVQLNSIMQLNYQTTWISELSYATSHLLCQTDPFIHDFKMSCKKVNFMSEYSEPELD